MRCFETSLCDHEGLMEINKWTGNWCLPHLWPQRLPRWAVRPRSSVPSAPSIPTNNDMAYRFFSPRMRIMENSGTVPVGQVGCWTLHVTSVFVGSCRLVIFWGSHPYRHFKKYSMLAWCFPFCSAQVKRPDLTTSWPYHFPLITSHTTSHFA